MVKPRSSKASKSKRKDTQPKRKITFLMDVHSPASVDRIREEWKKADLILLEMAPEEFELLTSKNPVELKGMLSGFESRLRKLLIEMKDKIIPIDNISLRKAHLSNMYTDPLVALLFKINRDLYMAKRVKDALKKSDAKNVCITVGANHYLYHIIKRDLEDQGAKVTRRFTFKGKLRYTPLAQLERYIFFNLLREGRVRDYDLENLSKRLKPDKSGLLTIPPEEFISMLPKEARELPRDKVEKLIYNFINEEEQMQKVIDDLASKGYSLEEISEKITALKSWTDAWEKLKKEIEKTKAKDS